MQENQRDNVQIDVTSLEKFLSALAKETTATNAAKRKPSVVPLIREEN